MATTGLDVSKLKEYARLMAKASKEMASDERKFLQKQGTELAKTTRRIARAAVARKRVVRKTYKRFAGQYHRSIKRGKFYIKAGWAQIRVYSGDPIAHLIEDGWTPKKRDGELGNSVAGKQVLKRARDAVQRDYEQAVNKFVDEQLDKFAKEGRA